METKNQNKKGEHMTLNELSRIESIAKLYSELKDADCLGYDSIQEAFFAVITEKDFDKKWECSKGLIDAVTQYQMLKSNN